ncbi:MAG: hypothetical protein ABSE67_10515 [Xanthobacteraceae bacterium]
MNRHQADRLRQSRIRARFTQQFVTEGAPIKRLMFRSNRREKVIGAEILGRQHTDSERGIRQAAMETRKPFVCDKARRIDEDFAGVEEGLQNIGKHVERREIREFLGGDVKAERTR